MLTESEFILFNPDSSIKHIMSYLSTHKTPDIYQTAQNLISDPDLNLMVFKISEKKSDINDSHDKNTYSELRRQIEIFITEEIEKYNAGEKTGLFLLFSSESENLILFFYSQNSYYKLDISLSGNSLKDSDCILILIEKSDEKEKKQYDAFIDEINKFCTPVFIKDREENSLLLCNEKGISFLESHPGFLKSDEYKRITVLSQNKPYIFNISEYNNDDVTYLLKKTESESWDKKKVILEYFENINILIALQKRYFSCENLITQFAEQFELIPWHLDIKNKEVIIETAKFNIDSYSSFSNTSKHIKIKELKGIIYDDDFKVINKIKDEAYKNNYLSFRNNIRLIINDSRPVPFQLTGVVDTRNPNSNLVFGYLKNLRKIENHKEDIRRLNKEAESLHAFQIAFLKLIHHELKAPVNKLIGYSEILSKENDLNHENKILYYGNIKKYTDKLLSILDSSLEYSYTEPEINSGKSDEKIYISQFLKIVAEVVRSKNKTISIKPYYDYDVIISTYKIEKLAVAIACLVFCFSQSNRKKEPVIYAKISDCKLLFIISDSKETDHNFSNFESISYMQFLDKNIYNKSLELDMDIAISYSLLVDSNINLYNDDKGNDIFVIETTVSSTETNDELSYKMTAGTEGKNDINIMIYENESTFSTAIYNTLSRRFSVKKADCYLSLKNNYSQENPLIITAYNIDSDLVELLTEIKKDYPLSEILLVLYNNDQEMISYLNGEDMFDNVEILTIPFSVDQVMDFISK